MTGFRVSRFGRVGLEHARSGTHGRGPDRLFKGTIESLCEMARDQHCGGVRPNEFVWPPQTRLDTRSQKCQRNLSSVLLLERARGVLRAREEKKKRAGTPRVSTPWKLRSIGFPVAASCWKTSCSKPSSLFRSLYKSKGKMKHFVKPFTLETRDRVVRGDASLSRFPLSRFDHAGRIL